MRVFVAVEIPEPIRADLPRLQASLSEAGMRNVRWVRPSAIHLIFRFCGEISSEIVQCVGERFFSGAPFPPFQVRLGRLGVFPPKGPPRVLFLGFEQVDRLRQLAAWVADRVEAADLPRERRAFQPHLTLGRFEAGARSGPVDGLQAPKEIGGKEMSVESFVLFRSHLGPEGARYETVREFRLLGEMGI